MRYLLGDASSLGNLYAALAFLPLGLFFDFMDGKVARWRKKSSMMGQELDSLADLVRGRFPLFVPPPLPHPFLPLSSRLHVALGPVDTPFLAHLGLTWIFSQISFGVSPAIVAFAIGIRTPVDHVCLAFFVLCGLTRLARFNVTVTSIPKDTSGKARYFEGTPIPTTLAIDLLMAWWAWSGRIHDAVPGGVALAGTALEMHPAVLLFVAHGCAMTSKTIHIPKP